MRCQCLQLLLTSGFLLGKPAAQVISSQLLTQEATRRRRLSISVKFRLLSRPSLEHQEIFFQITAVLQMPGTGMVEADSYPTWFEEVVECEKADQLPASETFSSKSPPSAGLRCSNHFPLNLPTDTCQPPPGWRFPLREEDTVLYSSD